MSVTQERTLGQRDLNRALLARQLLLERERSRLPRALERIGGLQAQYAPSMYIGLWSRLEGFERDQLTRALERRSVVQGTLLRSTIHLVSARDYWLFAIGVRRGRREWGVRNPNRPSAKEAAALARRLRPRIAKGPMRRSELVELLGGSPALNTASLWLEMVRVPPSGTWEQRRADLYAAAEDWLGPAEVSEQEGLQHLARRYLEGFGPATPKDIADWAGIPVRPVAKALEGMSLRRFRAEGGEELLDLPRAPLPDPDTPAPVRFLPTWDATLLVHARRTQILPEEHRPKVFSTRTPQSVPTFTVDGAVAGTWRFDKGKVVTKPFGRLDAAARRELAAEGERLAEFHA